jgi:hypothetical protein
LYRVFFAQVQITTFVPVGGTNQYKCPLIGPRRRHLPPTQYKWHTFVPGGGSDPYKCEASTFVPVGATARYISNVSTFVPALVVARYRCATAIFPSSYPLPEPPSPQGEATVLELAKHELVDLREISSQVQVEQGRTRVE